MGQTRSVSNRGAGWWSGQGEGWARSGRIRGLVPWNAGDTPQGMKR